MSIDGTCAAHMPEPLGNPLSLILRSIQRDTFHYNLSYVLSNKSVVVLGMSIPIYDWHLQ